MTTMGERLKELIDKKGICQKDLAEKVGCTDAAISHYIKGDRVPRASVLTKIAIALDTTSDYLMEGVTYKDLVEKYYVSLSTVKAEMARAFKTFGVNNKEDFRFFSPFFQASIQPCKVSFPL